MTPADAARAMFQAADRYRQKDWPGAIEICDQVLSQEPRNVGALLMKGAIKGQMGEIEESIDLLHRAVFIAPDDVNILNALGAAYRTNGQLRPAETTLRRAISIQPRFAPAIANYAGTLLDLQEHVGARKYFEIALSIDPNIPSALANFAALEEEEHNIETARQLAARSLTLDPANAIAITTLGRVALREGNSERALALLLPLRERTDISPLRRAIVENCIGEAFDGCGEYDKAFAAFQNSQSARFSKEDSAYENTLSPLGTVTTRKLLGLIEQRALAPAPALKPDRRAAPVFLLGFPRSGTTLLGQILASHPDVCVLEEKDTFFDSYESFLLREGALESWGSQTAAQLEAARDKYWEKVDQVLGPKSEGKLIIDKQPLLTPLLPMVMRIFPDAKIVLATRDPRDVVLSCFQQRFAQHLPEFRRMETLVDYYDLVMTLCQAFRRTGGASFVDYKYEDLLVNFDDEVKRLLEFLGLEWNDNVRHFNQTALKATIRAPSSRQVVKPLYTTSKGKWTRYERHLAPHIRTLDKWVAAFGYEKASPGLQ